ncbi:uncharacterized protein Bfra_000669 [Botrytis fragariae]|uniref:Uncharacterized protein n=1 Tax=Botrytis fragariae TaxID=1964551 RepID=A0A8H6B3I5_9HELO|nr:uncharacterized protein Bfra_000669 [Botrytis fragariae]KAF5878503.1 hypothetical protein Bfra_000669 [Botrytis fragariae]
MTFIRIAISVIEHVPDGDVHREVGETCFRSLAGQNAPSEFQTVVWASRVTALKHCNWLVSIRGVFRLFGVNHRKLLQLGETGGLES